MPAAGPEALAEDSSKTTSILRTTCEALDPGALLADLAGRDPDGSSRFEIRRVLGAGSFGKVTLAFDRVLHREVAIKQPRERLAPRARDAFVHEARLAAQIRHPGIVVVHDVAVDKSEIPYVVYEYVEGGSLR
ncbi:MAG TPA: protein kinase, partial [Pirellulaceae bacterium]|nr:protein kinase [Pirellulaceae bacterium]